MYMIHPMGIENGIIRLSDKANIPIDINNKDYQQYLEWLAEDEANQPADWQSNYGEE